MVAVVVMVMVMGMVSRIDNYFSFRVGVRQSAKGEDGEQEWQECNLIFHLF
jgi:hypothetical protein